MRLISVPLHAHPGEYPLHMASGAGKHWPVALHPALAGYPQIWFGGHGLLALHDPAPPPVPPELVPPVLVPPVLVPPDPPVALVPPDPPVAAPPVPAEPESVE